MKKSVSLVLVLVLVLSLAACGTQQASPSTASGPVAQELKDVTIPAFSVTVNGITVDQTTMAAYPMFSVQATSVNSAGTKSTITYVGFSMRDVLNAAGLPETYIWLEASADDGYKVTLTGGAVLAETTLLAITKDGEPFDAAPWFAPCTSGTTGDYLKSCSSILVNTAERAPEISAAPTEAADAELALTGELPEIQDKTDKVDFAPYTFLVNGTAVTNDTLKNLSIYKITVVTENSEGALSEATYTGYKLSDVLAACGFKDAASVKVKANDAYETELSSELISSEYTLVAIEKDKETGEAGTIWLAPCSETPSKSYCKLVVEIITE